MDSGNFGAPSADNVTEMSFPVRFPAFVLLTALLLAAQPRPYRDPAGRYSFTVPANWTASPAGEMLTLRSGDSYALVAIIEGGGADPPRVAQFADQFGRQWKQYKRLQSGPAKLGGRDGAFAIYSGVNPAGVDAIVKAISAPNGTAAYLLLFSCPMNEWEAKKAPMEGIERSFVMGSAGISGAGRAMPSGPPQAPPQQVPPQRNVAAPQAGGGRQLPMGFTVAARNGASGQALTASFTGGRSARATFSGIFKLVGSYFDQPPQLRAAFADAGDRELQGFFHAVYQGVPVRGAMVITVDGTKGYAGLLFDRHDTFAQSFSGLSRQMQASLPKGAPASGGAPARRRIEPLQQRQLTDSSGWISLPANWTITGSYKGVVDAQGPDGQMVSLGGYQVAYTNPLPGTPPNIPTGPYRAPAQALGLLLDVSFQRALSRGLAQYQVIEQAPVQSPGGQSAYIMFKVNAQGKAQQGLALVTTKPIDNSQWFLYSSIVSSPVERFAQDLPTLWAIWKSWSVNPAVFRERMDAAIQSMRETSRIISETYANTQRTYDNVNAAWSQVIRGVTTVENIVTRVRTDIDTNIADRVVRDLNEQGYNYRVVPLPELVQ